MFWTFKVLKFLMTMVTFDVFLLYIVTLKLWGKGWEITIYSYRLGGCRNVPVAKAKDLGLVPSDYISAHEHLLFHSQRGSVPSSDLQGYLPGMQGVNMHAD